MPSEGSSPGDAGQQGDAWGEKLPRRLGLWSAVAVLVGSTIGSGIFRSPAEIAQHADQVGSFALVWVFGGVVALCGALAMAELAAMYPRTGGTYVYLREAYGRWLAFLFGWSELVILRPAAYGAIAIVSAEHLWLAVGRDGATTLFTIGLWPVSLAQVTAGVFIVLLGAVNYRGVELGALVQNVSTVLKVGALLLIIGLGLVLIPGEVPSAPPPEGPLPATGTASALGLALVSVLWAYDGWADVGFVSGEVRDPETNLPRAFIIGTATIVVLYLAINLVYLRVVPLEQMPGRPLIAADVTRALIGDAGARIVAAAVALSTFGTLNGSLMTGPRVFYAMAEDKLFFRALARVHPEHGTPSGAIVLSVILGVLFASVRTFGQLADQFVIGIWPFYALAVFAVFILRRTEPDRPRPYRTWGHPVVTAVFVLSSLFLLGNYAVRAPLVFAADLGIIALGLPVYWWWQRQG